MQLNVIWGVNRLRKSDQHSALVTLISYNKSLLPQDFGASKFESNAKPFDTHQSRNMCQAIFQQPLSQQQLLAWIRGTSKDYYRGKRCTCRLPRWGWPRCTNRSSCGNRTSLTTDVVALAAAAGETSDHRLFRPKHAGTRCRG